MRHRQLNYDYECAIEMFNRCNYSCEYCSGPRIGRVNHKRGYSKEDADSLIKFFNESSKKWLIGLSGGEPTIHPQYDYIIRQLRENHFFHIFTNLSGDLNEKFLELLDPRNVSLIKASLHPEGDESEFLKKAEILNSKGFNIVIIIVSELERSAQIERVSEFSNKHGIPFTLSVLEGPYRGKLYPQDYTDDETKYVLSHTHEAGNAVRLIKKITGGLHTLGMRCGASYNNFVLYMETGEINACESIKNSIGNIYEGTFNPANDFVKCPVINGCVGYDRNPSLPLKYLDTYRIENSFITSKFGPNQERLDFGLLKELEVFKIDKDSNLAATIIKRAISRVGLEFNDKKIALWGAGMYGAKFYQSILKYDPVLADRVSLFIDSLVDRRRTSVLGKPVISPKDALKLANHKVLITSYAFEDDIFNKCLKMGINASRLHVDILKPIGIDCSLF